MLRKAWKDYQELRNENGEAFKRHIPGTAIMFVIFYIIIYICSYGAYKRGEVIGKWLGKHEGYAERMMDEYSRNKE